MTFATLALFLLALLVLVLLLAITATTVLARGTARIAAERLARIRRSARAAVRATGLGEGRLAVAADRLGIDLREARQRYLAALEPLAAWLDSRWRLPVLGRFGLAAVLGLIPVLGDILSATLSFLLVLRALETGIPPRLILRMLGNIGLRLVVGAVPLVGDLLAFWLRANLRNMDLLKEHLRKHDPTATTPPDPPESRLWRFTVPLWGASLHYVAGFVAVAALGRGPLGLGASWVHPALLLFALGGVAIGLLAHARGAVPGAAWLRLLRRVYVTPALLGAKA